MRNCRMRGRKSYSWFPLSDVIFLSDKSFSQVCYRTLVAYNGGAFLGALLRFAVKFLSVSMYLAWKSVASSTIFVPKSVITLVYSLGKMYFRIEIIVGNYA